MSDRIVPCEARGRGNRSPCNLLCSIRAHAMNIRLDNLSAFFQHMSFQFCKVTGCGINVVATSAL